MITLQMTLWPYGDRALETALLSGRIWTASTRSGGPVHRYRIDDAEGRTIAEGAVDKTRSGHRNPLHLLERMLASIDLDALPRDHVTTAWDPAADVPARPAPAREPIDEARTALLERLWDLANADPTEEDAPGASQMSLRRVATLLGGDAILQHPLETLIDAHDLLSKGLPGAALRHLVEHLAVLGRSVALDTAVGMSLSAFERLKDAPSERLGVEHSGRTWTLAAILATGTAAFGTQEEAERWLDRPQIGLDQRRPIDLLATPAGGEVVATFLQRLVYAAYA